VKDDASDRSLCLLFHIPFSNLSPSPALTGKLDGGMARVFMLAARILTSLSELSFCKHESAR
jgi:hypothetical protein